MRMNNRKMRDVDVIIGGHTPDGGRRASLYPISTSHDYPTDGRSNNVSLCI